MTATTTRVGRRWLGLGVLCCATVLVALDTSILFVAFSRISTELGMSESELGWAVNAYLVPSGGVLLVAGVIGDAIGLRRVFVAGLAVFTVASLVCALALTTLVLVAGRVVQGVGAGMILGVVYGMVAALFGDASERARAMRIFGTLQAVSVAVGLAGAGFVVQLSDWRALFWANIPLGIMAIALAVRVLDRPQRGRRGRPDVVGASLVTVGSLVAMDVIVHGAERGWGSERTLLSAAGALVVLGAFVWRDARAKVPLVARHLLRSRSLMRGTAGLSLVFAGEAALSFVAVLYLQRVAGYGAFQTGLAVLPLTVALAIVAAVAWTGLQRRIGVEGMIVAGLAFMVVGLVVLAFAPSTNIDYVVHVLPGMFLVGIGAGLGYPRCLALAMSATTVGDSGAASGVANCVVSIAAAAGIAVAATIVADSSHTVALIVIATALAIGAAIMHTTGKVS